jgi:nitroreductase
MRDYGVRVHVLVTGMSGAGKSSVVGELRRRGYAAVDADDDGFAEPRAPYGEWAWRTEQVRRLLDEHAESTLFFSGCSEEQAQLPFDRTVLLTAPLPVLEQRLLGRTDNPYGKDPDQLRRVRDYVRTVEPALRRSADVVVDTTKPLAAVVDEVLAATGPVGDGTGLHPLLAVRWSPTTFDPAYEVEPAAVDLLLEAARWAPSAGNSQPWAFIAGRRGDHTHARLVPHLLGSAAGWAPTASVLIANLQHRFVEGTDWAYSEFSAYDLGQAVAHMTIQGQALGLHARQFRAFNRERISAEFGVPEHWEVATMTAFGRVPNGVTPHAAIAPGAITLPRQRRDVDELRWTEPPRPARL